MRNQHERCGAQEECRNDANWINWNRYDVLDTPSLRLCTRPRAPAAAAAACYGNISWQFWLILTWGHMGSYIWVSRTAALLESSLVFGFCIFLTSSTWLLFLHQEPQHSGGYSAHRIGPIPREKPMTIWGDGITLNPTGWAGTQYVMSTTYWHY